MKYVIENFKIYKSGEFSLSHDFCFDTLSDSVSSSADTRIVRGNNIYIFPGFTDVHVHLREPGFLYKETIKSGTMAAARGGFTRVCSMPNLNPCPDSDENLAVQEEIIKNTAVVGVIPYASITKGQAGDALSDMDILAERVAGFSDDGRGVQNRDLMRAAMLKAKSLGKMIVAHCEDNSLLRGGYIHDGEYARLHGHRGICSESEWGPVKRDLELVRETGCAYHVCHVSTAETVELIRQAKKEGLDVSCETGPHYLVFDDMMLEEDGRFKMNPPIRSARDRDALIEGILDGTIEMIATDHAPHSAEEKSRGLAGSVMGVVGIETSFPVMYEYFVKKGILSLEKLIELMSINPCKRFGIKNEMKDNFTVFDLGESYTVDPGEFLSMGRATPFEGMTVSGKCRLTVSDGHVAYENF
ncbi:MAG: dihydroorotase [Ruminococcaceae bacterium]|nr:dihydroorotase [Oscillospiraceae bacterium]